MASKRLRIKYGLHLAFSKHAPAFRRNAAPRDGVTDLLVVDAADDQGVRVAVLVDHHLVAGGSGVQPRRQLQHRLLLQADLGGDRRAVRHDRVLLDEVGRHDLARVLDDDRAHIATVQPAARVTTHARAVHTQRYLTVSVLERIQHFFLLHTKGTLRVFDSQGLKKGFSNFLFHTGMDTEGFCPSTVRRHGVRKESVIFQFIGY